MMTTRSTGRKPAAAKPAATQADTAVDTVSAGTVAPRAVFHDGEQRTGTIHNVAADTAQYWIRRGWAKPHDTAADT